MTHEEDCKTICEMLNVKYLDSGETVGFCYDVMGCKWWIPNPVMFKLKELMNKVKVVEEILRNMSDNDPNLMENK